jgi:hypothetical protein
MDSRKLALVAAASFGTTCAPFGCSSANAPSDGIDSGLADAAADGTAESGNFPDANEAPDVVATDAGDGGSATCTLQPLPAGGVLDPLPMMSKQDICGTGDVTSAINACIGMGGSSTACLTWTQAPDGTGTATQRACGECLFGNSTSTIGVYLDYGSTTFATPNPAGCVEDVDTSVAGQRCATDLWNLYACEGLACIACNDANDPQGALVSACYQSADNVECAEYLDAINAECASHFIADGGAASVCNPNKYTGTETFIALGAAMCGGS